MSSICLWKRASDRADFDPIFGIGGTGRMNIVSLVQWAQIILGLLSAALWGVSAIMRPKKTSNPNPPGDDGDLMYSVGDGNYFVWNIKRQGQISALAAICTALAVLLQAMAAYSD
jgi:hypothetical protein